MHQSKKVDSGLAASVLTLGVIVSLLTLAYARTSSSSVIQLVVVLLSMGLMFYSSHPLGHFFTARAYGVGTEYFFLGKSDFRKLKLKPVSGLGAMMPTIGTRLERGQLTSLAPRKRGYIFGSGVIFSVALMAVQLFYVFIAGFSFLSLVFASLFFVATLATEVLFSTKVGDLAKMETEFRKSHSP